MRKGEADEEEEEQQKEEEKTRTVLFRGCFAVALLLYSCFAVVFRCIIRHSSSSGGRGRSLDFMPRIFLSSLLHRYHDGLLRLSVRVTGSPTQSSSSSFGASRLSLPRLQGRFMGFLGRVRRAALFLSTTLSDASLRTSPAVS